MGEVKDDSYTRGRLAFMEGSGHWLSLNGDYEFAIGWLDAYEEFVVEAARDKARDKARG